MKNNINFRLSLENTIVDSNYLDVFPDTIQNVDDDIEDLIGFNVRVDNERFSLNNDRNYTRYFFLDKSDIKTMFAFCVFSI